jgi:hypothetical protein
MGSLRGTLGKSRRPPAQVRAFMKQVILRAHFDGKQIRLDEPFEIKPDTPLRVIVGDGDTLDSEREDWWLLSSRGLAEAYGEDEPEYTLDMIKEPNPDYEGG